MFSASTNFICFNCQYLIMVNAHRINSRRLAGSTGFIKHSLIHQANNRKRSRVLPIPPRPPTKRLLAIQLCWPLGPRPNTGPSLLKDLDQERDNGLNLNLLNSKLTTKLLGPKEQNQQATQPLLFNGFRQKNLQPKIHIRQFKLETTG